MLFALCIIQLLTIEALDTMWYRPESTNIARGGAEVNIGIFRSISHHVQCLNSQQLFYYIISLSKKKQQQQQQNLSYELLNFFFYMMTNWFHSVKRGKNAYFICNYNYRQRTPPIPNDTTNFYIKELIQNTTSRARMDWGKLTMFWCLQAIPGGVVSRDFVEK